MAANPTSTTKHTSVHKPKKSGIWHYAILFVCFILVLGGIYLYVEWTRNYQHKITDSISDARIVSALLHMDHLDTLSGNETDKELDYYQVLKGNLTRFISVSPMIAQVYIASYRSGKLVLLVNSCSKTTPALSRPGEIYLDESTRVQQTYQSGDVAFTGRVINSLGEWVSVLYPVELGSESRPIAVLGVTYRAEQWYQDVISRMVPNAIIAFSVLVLLFALLGILWEHLTLRKLSNKLAIDEALFHSVFDQAPIGISIGLDDQVTYAAPDGRYGVNHAFEVILGRNKEELEHTNWADITFAADLATDNESLSQFHAHLIDRYSLEKRFVRPDGMPIWTRMTISSLKGQQAEESMHLCVLEDINEQKRTELMLLESERSKSVLLSHLPGLAYRCKYDRLWTMEFVSQGCEILTGYKPENLVGNRDLSFNVIIAPEYRARLWDEWSKARELNVHFHSEYEIVTKQAGRKWVLELGQFVFDEANEPVALEGIIIDISDRKLREAQVEYMSEHDYLTDTYNRSHFEQEKVNLSQAVNWPLAIVMADINGVRLINDAFGHAEGDRLIIDVAKLLQKFCRDSDVLCRSGGDEFILLLPNTDEAETLELLDKITQAIDQSNHNGQPHPYEVNLSFGFSILRNQDQTVDQIITEAEGHLNHRKLLNRRSSHNSLLASIMATLYARSQETEEHGIRLTGFTRMIGQYLNLDTKAMDDLVLLSMLHDIGKIGVDDRILNKPGSLTVEEWEFMRKHSEIGSRIALSTPELEHIANDILHHHERWDGTGYPSNLKGEEIPLAARILAVADAYDAMTEDRVYRLALSQQTALEEIENNAGTQFDPNIARIFIELMRKEISIASPDVKLL